MVVEVIVRVAGLDEFGGEGDAVDDEKAQESGEGEQGAELLDRELVSVAVEVVAGV